MASQQELVAELNKHNVEISNLKNRLDEIDREKESWFNKKSSLSAKIRELIQKIKGNKSKRDFLTDEIKGIKPKRDAINKGMPEKLKELDRLRKEKSGLAKSAGIKESPSRIKQQIEKLEFKIETDTASFEKEKGLMKQIKGLKKIYNSSAEIMGLNNKARSVSEEVRATRKEANELHRLIQEKARQSQVLHEEVISISKEIDKLKSEENDAFGKFSELKKIFHETGNELKGKLKIMNDVKSQLDRIYFDRKERRKQEQESFLKSKEDAVNEKIRKRQKLTTEDLLVFQKVDRK
ncbi:hypothetical protein HYV80_03505 [Candidatus Woesearchaeota archaeon]|nr:hypothetical protein [Candidatus Woesearchaeota archaeon]